jgi:hypothetical protein
METGTLILPVKIANLTDTGSFSLVDNDKRIESFGKGAEEP